MLLIINTAGDKNNTSQTKNCPSLGALLFFSTSLIAITINKYNTAKPSHKPKLSNCSIDTALYPT